jgi:two-component system, OmpR family, alkaline phosphatase synthesis response regulator PhoP
MNTTGKRILLIEDEKGLVHTLTDRLSSEGYIVSHAGDGISGEKMAIEGYYDVILLDVMLPKKNGFDVIRDLRKERVTTPVLMLTACGQLNERVIGIKLGSDDYLIKPFEMLELLARIEALLRRPVYIDFPASDLTSYTFGDITVDFSKMEVRKKHQRIEISSREFQLLRYFIEHKGEALSRETILNDVWGYDAMPSTRTIDTHVTWLRQKIEENHKFPRFIQTIFGYGYKFIG